MRATPNPETVVQREPEGGERASGAVKGREVQVNPGRCWPLQDTGDAGLTWGDTS
jgi:hypothetical protein